VTEPTIRRARRDDAAAIARLHLGFAAYYLELAPNDFRLPEQDGLVDYVAADLEPADAMILLLVAESDNDVVGHLIARVLAPYADARYELVPTLAETRLQIDYVVTDERHRRRGVASALVRAAEEWGRAQGATVATTDTYAAGPLSVPFWQERMGYRTRSLRLVKPLD
jgi:GNAT superfamily N-acetyltransferase